MGTYRTKPSLLVVADRGRSVVERLFASRGFAVMAVPPALADRLSPAPELVVLDFSSRHAARLLAHFAGLDRPPLLIGIDPVGDDADLLDAGFRRPVDPARLFVRAVALLGQRRDPLHAGREIPGVVGVVRGNALFELLKKIVSRRMSSVNAGPALQTTVQAVGSSPADVSMVELETAFLSGRLAEGLSTFVDDDALPALLDEVRWTFAFETPARRAVRQAA